MLGQEFCQHHLSTLSGINVLLFTEGRWGFLLARAVQCTVKISLRFAFPGRPRQLVAVWAAKGRRQSAASAMMMMMVMMMLLRERAGYRGRLTIESGGASGRQEALPSPPLYGNIALPVRRAGNGALPLAGWAGAGPGGAGRRGYAKQGAVSPHDWSVRRRSGAWPVRGGARRRQRNAARGTRARGGAGPERGSQGLGNCGNRAQQALLHPWG